jgi:hypothetical protein
LVATRTIHPQEELFLDYHGAFPSARHPYLASSLLFPNVFGDEFIQYKGSGTIHPNIGLASADDYEVADRIVQALWKLYQTLSDEQKDLNHQPRKYLDQNHTFLSTTFTTAQWIDLLYRIRNQELLLYPRAEFIVQLLPRTLVELQRAYELGVARYHLHRTQNQQPPFQVCLNSIREEHSRSNEDTTFAVANKSFQKGEVLTVSPLLFIPDRQAAMTVATNSTSQFLENYCFGHRYAKLLLCPLTHAALIRHDPKKANVRIQWALNASATTASRNADLLASPLQDINEMLNPFDPTTFSSSKSLVMEYVATTYISEGDELWLDFGDEYGRALENHRSKIIDRSSPSKPPRPNSILLSSDPSMEPFYSHECDVYPNLKIQYGEDYRSWEDFHSNRMSNRQNWPRHISLLYHANRYASWYPCQVVDVNIDLDVYDVVVYSKGYPSQPKGNNTIIRQLRGCPKDRIRVVDAPYQSSLHDPVMEFRHYIPIPDDEFPFHWRNDYKTSSYWNIGAVGESRQTFDFEESLRDASCGLYLAKSNIANAGFGLYTAIDIPAADVLIGSSLPAIIVHQPIGDLSWGTSWVGMNYVWSGETFSISYDGFPDFEVSILNGLFG